MPGTDTTRQAPESADNTIDSLLRRAAARRAPVGLLVESGGLNRRMAGELLAAVDGVLEIRLESGAQIRAAAVESGSVNVRFELDGRRYAFDTRFAASEAPPASGVVRIEAPSQLRSSDRRRSIRRRLRRATGVMLVSAGPGPRRTAQGVMLNLSAEGLACRIRRHDSAGIRPGRTIRAMFQVEEPAEAIELDARVVTVTPAGTRDHLVVGLEFMGDNNNRRCRDRLCALLGATRRDGDGGTQT
jgi:c-di-GMP-binding flagellar brake protein YcgR